MNEYTYKTGLLTKKPSPPALLSATSQASYQAQMWKGLLHFKPLAIMSTGCPISVTNRINAAFDTHPL